jgi:hypothetical protein
LSRKGGKINIVEGIMGNIREKLYGYPWSPSAAADLNASSIAFFQLDFFLISLLLLPMPRDTKKN